MNLSAVKDQPAGVIVGANFLVIDGKTIDVSWREAAILNRFIASLGAPVKRANIMDLLFSDDPDGGPDESYVNRMVSQIRAKLRLYDLPLEIVSVYGIGWSMRRTS